jgi:hypothetical protein
MSLTKGKNNVAEIDGVRCSVVETGLTESRANFLKELLQENGYNVKCEPEKTKDGASTGAYILGVTDILFNPVIKVYQHGLFRKDGSEVSPAWWNQWPEDQNIPYYQVIR